MKDFIKPYHVKLIAKGPIFVGNGEEYNKKEYVFDGKKGKVTIPKIEEMYSYLRRQGLSREFEKFMLNDRNHDLGEWLREKRIRGSDMEKWTVYSMDCGDAILEKGKMHILQCIKNAYGNPYIPGSSIKGMLRTILLSDQIVNEPARYQQLAEEIRNASGQSKRREQYLLREMKNVEVEAFHCLGLNKKDKTQMVNDSLSGLIVSDSNELSVEQLGLFQKVDVHRDGTEKRLPILRECILPGTEISFTITIDRSKCRYTIEELKKAVESFSDNNYQFFLSKYRNIAKPDPGTVWLGGGAGFTSKTVNYPLHQARGLQMAMEVFDKTLSGKQKAEHKHNLDAKIGVSPHVLKCTYYKGARLQFGECGIQFE